MSKITLKVSGEVGAGKSAICDKIEQFLKILGVKVEWVGGDQERNLGICDLPKEASVEVIEEHSIDKIVNMAPVGFMMVHSHAGPGGDRGFSWVKDDVQFSTEWERVALFDEAQLADLHQRAVTAEERVKELEAALREVTRQRDEHRARVAPAPSQDDPVALWAEIHKLRAELQGPDGHATWKDAAISERTTAAKRIMKWRDSFDSMHQRAMRAEAKIHEMESAASVKVAHSLEVFKEALHTHFNTYEIPTRLGILAIMKNIDKVFEENK